MSIHHHDPAETTPAGVVAELVDRLRDALGEVLWAAQSDEVVVSVVEGLQVLVSVAAGVEAGAVVEADARGLARERRGYGSTGDWLTHTAGLRRGEGNRRLVRARALTGPLERTRRGLLEGRVSPAQADIIVDAVEDLPSQDWTRRRGERLMLTHAGRLDATDLAKTGHHLVEVVDPDAADRRLEAALEREERASPGPVPRGHRGPGRWSAGQGPGLGRGRSPAQGRPPLADLPGTRHRPRGGRGHR
jgi:hypothetical protein